MSRQSKEITFYVTECMEFPDMGEYHENIPTIKEAYELYKKIPSGRMSGVKGIGFVLHDGSDYDDLPCGIMWGGRVDRDAVNLVKYYENNPLVNQAISDLEKLIRIPSQNQRSPKF